MKLVFKLFCTYFKIGLFTFGGGYAMIPLIEKEVIEKKKWISEDILLEVIAIAESTPGPIAINSATFIGNRVAGFWGSFAATLGVVLPSFIIISIIANVLQEFGNLKAVKYAFWGIRAGVLALILKALLNMAKKMPKKIFSYCIAALAFVLVAFTPINVIYVVAACAILGIVYSLVFKGRAKK